MLQCFYYTDINSPYIFLTNGGGKTEDERCIDLSRQLDIEVSPAQFICGMLSQSSELGSY
jgi:ribonucleotide monophosphatase NagD (HAD superfamily)